MKLCIRIFGLALILALVAGAAVSATTIQDAKALPDGSSVTLSGKVVTYAGSGFFYIEEDSRGIGIRVEKSAHGLTAGMKADVAGTMATRTDNNERYISAATAAQTAAPNDTGTILPVSIAAKSVGGGDWLVSGTAGQRGYGVGLNNTGLLVKIWGEFQQIDSTTFTVDGFICVVPSGTFLSSSWQNVTVTGISSIALVGSSLQPILLARDINILTPAEALSTPAAPAGDSGPLVGMSYGYTVAAVTSNYGHTVEYSFNWGDGSASSAWSTSRNAVHAWTTTSAKTVTVSARCQEHNDVSATSAALTVTPVTQLASSPWPVFRRDIRHSALSLYHDPTVQLPVWSRSVGNGYSSPSVGRDGTIYISGSSSLYALNPDGSVKWSKTLNESTRSTPAVGSDGTIYIGGSALVYAFSSTGTQKWTFTVSGDITSSPVVGSDGTVYVGTRGGYLYALTPGTSSATQKWRFSTGDMHMTSPCISADGSVIYTGGGTSLWAIYTSSGAQKWQRPIGVAMTSSAALSPDGTTVYVGAYDGNMYSVATATGNVNWQVPVGFVNASTSASPAIGSDGTIYLGSNFGTLYAVNPSGSQKWIYETGADIRASVALNSDGTVVVASYDGYVRGLDSTSGLEKWHVLLPAANYASPAITANGTVIACSTGGVVYGNIGGTPALATPPTNLVVNMTTDTQASLSWSDNSSDEYGFRVERRMGSVGAYTTLASVGAGINTYTDSGLLSGEIYYYRVCAYQIGGNSAYTNQVPVITPGIQTPDSLVATAISGTRIDLAWTDRSSDEAGFSIERSVGPNGLFEEIDQVGAGVSSYSDISAYPARYYYYRVRAFDATRQSSYSNLVEVLTPGKDFSEITRGNTSRKQMALTFDAGTAAIQSSLLSTLKTNNVYCNFFITGVVTQLQSSMVAQIASDGHFTGNHTWDHPDLRYVSDDKIISEFNTTEDIVYATGGKHTRPYFRAPYGAKNQHVLDVAAANGFQHVYWTTDTGDSLGASTAQIISGAESGAGNGAIILCHCTMANTAAAMPTVIPYLKSAGYELVTIPELVAPKQASTPAGTLNSGWNLISLPIEPALEFPHIVFRGVTIDGNLKRWDKKTSAEITYSASAPGPFGNINADEGYWLYVPIAASIKFNGASATTSRRIRLPVSTNPAAYALIGYPFETSQSFTNCQVYNANAAAPQTRSLADAITAGWIPDTFYSWNSATQTQYAVNLLTSQLDPWKGYKAAALVPGVQLIIPKP